jgi:hypothetical protein
MKKILKTETPILVRRAGKSQENSYTADLKSKFTTEQGIRGKA